MNYSAENLICKEIFTIDPGINGAISKYRSDRLESWNLEKMKTFEEQNYFFEYQKSICKLPLVFIENITTYQADASNVGKMFQLDKLKRHYADLRCALKNSGFPFIEVMPIHWMKYLNIYIPGEDRNVRKKRFKDIAKDDFPEIKVTLKNADSLLLINFARQKLKHDNLWILKNTKEPKVKNLFNY